MTIPQEQEGSDRRRLLQARGGSMEEGPKGRQIKLPDGVDLFIGIKRYSN